MNEYEPAEFNAEDEIEIDETLRALYELLHPSDMTVLNPARLQDMAVAHSIVQRCLGACGDVSIVCQQSMVAPDIGHISIEGSEIKLSDTGFSPSEFSKVAALASNTETYPIEGNKIRMTFTFSNLTLPL